MIRHKKVEGGVMFYFDYDTDADAFIQFVEAMQDPIRDPDSGAATKRLLEIREWCDERDPYGATAAGFLVRLFRNEIDQRIYSEPQPSQEFALPLVLAQSKRGGAQLLEDQRGVVMGTLDLRDLINQLWRGRDESRGFDL